MAATPSTMLKLGTKAPAFSLPDFDKRVVSLLESKGQKGTLVIFICNHCPYVIHLIEDLVVYTNELKESGIATLFISSNDIVKYPKDSPQKMKEFASHYGFKSPYLFDETQEVAKSYMAACTPDFFLFDDQLELQYRGQYDSSRPGNDVELSGKDLKTAVDYLLRGDEIPSIQIPSIGCNIKWKAGNEPDYFG